MICINQHGLEPDLIITKAFCQRSICLCSQHIRYPYVVIFPDNRSVLHTQYLFEMALKPCSISTTRASMRVSVSVAPKPTGPQQLAQRLASAGMACMLLLAPVDQAQAKLPPPAESPDRCTLKALDNFAETRAKFSQVRQHAFQPMQSTYAYFPCSGIMPMWHGA